MIEAQDYTETLASEDEDCWFLRKVGTYLPDYTTSHPRRQQSCFSHTPGGYAILLLPRRSRRAVSVARIDKRRQTHLSACPYIVGV
jgi:hypothetical protein